MGWGDILTSPVVMSAAGNAIGGGTGQAISFLGSLFGANEANKQKTKNTSDYEAALTAQKNLAALQVAIAKQRATFDSTMQSRILQQTGNESATLLDAYNRLGPMPQFDPAKLQADYGQLRTQAFDTLDKLVTRISSQDKANEISRLGGATSRTAAANRQSAEFAQFAPQYTQADQAAFDEAVSRNTNTMNLFNTSRTNTMNELKGLFQPGITNETALYNPNNVLSALQTASTGTQGIMNETSSNAEDATKTGATHLTDLSTKLAMALNPQYQGGRIGNGVDPLTDYQWSTLMRGV